MSSCFLLVFILAVLPFSFAVILRAAVDPPAPTVNSTHLDSAQLILPGAGVVLCGLQRDAPFNGRAARVLRWTKEKAVYVVRINGGDRYLLQPGNLAREGQLCPSATASRQQNFEPSKPEPIEFKAAAWKNSSAVEVGYQECNPPSRDVGCTEACDDCFMTDYRYCYAVCEVGCQVYCEESTAGTRGCSQNEKWRACPIPVGCSFDDDEPVPKGGCPPMSSKYRSCTSENEDGCPENYLY